jgi:hypothetical protein
MNTSEFRQWLVLGVVGIGGSLILILVPSLKDTWLLPILAPLISMSMLLFLGGAVVYGLEVSQRRYTRGCDTITIRSFFDRPVFGWLSLVYLGLVLSGVMYGLVLFERHLQQFTDWRLLGVPSTGAPVELARYAHRADCLEAREAAIRRAWAERQQLPNLECAASVGYWERLYKFLTSSREGIERSKNSREQKKTDPLNIRPPTDSDTVTVQGNQYRVIKLPQKWWIR